MSFLYQKPGWPSFVWDSAALANLHADVVCDRAHLLGRLETLGLDAQLRSHLDFVSASVVKTSAIEGEALSLPEVRSSIASRLGLDVGGSTSAARNVEGVIEVMLDAAENAQSPLTVQRLNSWHAASFPTARSGLRPIVTGALRPTSTDPMRVVSGPIGRERVHFEAPGAADLPLQVKRFLAWFESEETPDQLLKAGVAHLWFLTLHPYEDGNGRLARALTDLLLARGDGSPRRFFSLSTQIEAERSDYYNHLERAQRGGLDITEWMTWFLGCVHRAVQAASEIADTAVARDTFWRFATREPLNPRQHLVLSRMNGDFEGHLQTAKYAKLAKCSPDTAQRDIRELLDRGVLVRNPGGGRSTSYRLGDPPR